VADEECLHGLDPAWCTFCRQKAAGVLPPGVRRARPPAAPKATRARTAPATRTARSTSGGAPANSSRGPADALVKARKVLFHASAYGSWPSIAELGLFPASQLIPDDPRLLIPRNEPLGLKHPSGHDISLREQRPMMRANIEAHLDGIGLTEWLDILNQRIFLFARQKDLLTFLGRYQETEGQDVVVFDTARLMAAAQGRLEVATVSPTAPVAWERCPCRNRGTFEPIDSFVGDIADIQEVAIVGAIEKVPDLVVRVMRYHPDRTTEVLVA
jgi:hypothetical protein